MSLDELERAYRVLEIRRETSALQIKRAYKRLAKTWHPDKWPPGSQESQDAGKRMREINEAFQLIKHAPLRFAMTQESVPATVAHPRPSHTAIGVDRIEYGVRIVTGFVVGALGSFVWILNDLPLAAALAVPVVTAAASAFYGDAFWRWLLRFWLLW